MLLISISPLLQRANKLGQTAGPRAGAPRPEPLTSAPVAGLQYSRCSILGLGFSFVENAVVSSSCIYVNIVYTPLNANPSQSAGLN